jgi:hypothetical protein
MSADEILATPFVLIGTIDQIADQILRNRERYGFTYYTVHGPYADTFAPVIKRVHTMRLTTLLRSPIRWRVTGIMAATGCAWCGTGSTDRTSST